MRFWDTSAVVPLLVAQPVTGRSAALVAEDPAMAVWWGTPVECVAALARLDREGAIAPRAYGEALARLGALDRHWMEVAPTTRVRETAARILRTSTLRAGDALQLAAAVVMAEDRPSTMELVTFDARLGHAAVREGFVVIGPGHG